MSNSIPGNKYKQYFSSGKAISFPFKSICYMCIFFTYMKIYMSTYISVQLGCAWCTRTVWNPLGLGFKEELQVAVDYYVRARN